MTKQTTVKAAFVTLTGTQPEKPFRANTARDLYYKDLVAHVGKGEVALVDLYKRWEEDAPKLPKSGKVEPPAGWVAFFCRIGVAKVVHKQVAAK